MPLHSGLTQSAQQTGRYQGARPRIPPGAGRDRAGHLGIDQLHSGSAVADRQCFRLHLRVHPHFRLQVAYDAVHHQAGLADDRHRAWFLPSLYRRVRNAVSAGHDMGIFITGSWKLPVIMVGFGMFLLFDRATFHSRAINRIAQSAFAVYLITDYAASEKLLWAQLFNLQNLYQQPLAILQILSILLAIYVTCTLIDFIRQALFAVTLDRRRGRRFDPLWSMNDLAVKRFFNYKN